MYAPHTHRQIYWVRCAFPPYAICLFGLLWLIHVCVCVCVRVQSAATVETIKSETTASNCKHTFVKRKDRENQMKISTFQSKFYSKFQASGDIWSVAMLKRALQQQAGHNSNVTQGFTTWCQMVHWWHTNIRQGQLEKILWLSSILTISTSEELSSAIFPRLFRLFFR